MAFPWLLLILWQVEKYAVPVPEYILLLYQNILWYMYLLVHIVFVRNIPTFGELLTVAVRWLQTFANILFYEHQNDIFKDFC